MKCHEVANMDSVRPRGDVAPFSWTFHCDAVVDPTNRRKWTGRLDRDPCLPCLRTRALNHYAICESITPIDPAWRLVSLRARCRVRPCRALPSKSGFGPRMDTCRDSVGTADLQRVSPASSCWPERTDEGHPGGCCDCDAHPRRVCLRCGEVGAGHAACSTGRCGWVFIGHSHGSGKQPTRRRPIGTRRAPVPGGPASAGWLAPGGCHGSRARATGMNLDIAILEHHATLVANTHFIGGAEASFAELG
ncbi:hypothetical protein PYCCODRAFT_791077 [Trametes coccinea BRFM310]|uniref:Uncharacterized protein n=1 Tax=Trametes coccinea (strain BRFM310) TaxID=1353009 RepID=A0A1Y2J0V9_TRAC3|nr:hypothetical protein PYCCODRAFT_791077 [Trametes coccinea BRFM310]